MKIAKYITAILFLVSTKVFAVEYYCEATEKHDFGLTYGQETIYQAKFATKVEETKTGTYLSRCSMSFKNEEPEVTCDRYTVDKVVYDKNVKIKKYYVFNSQFDFQIFPNMKSLENNGRGGVQYGECKIVSP